MIQDFLEGLYDEHSKLFDTKIWPNKKFFITFESVKKYQAGIILTATTCD
jgi:hypothetical protein